MPAGTRQVAAIAVVDLARAVQRAGVASADAIRAIDGELAEQAERLQRGADLSALIEQRYPEAWLIALWQLAAADELHADIGARIGAHVATDARGLLSHVMAHCDTLGDAMNIYVRNMGLLNAAERWQIQRQHGELALEFRFSPANAYPRCAVERSMVAMLKWAEYFCDRALPLTQVEFSFPAPAHAALIRELFACPVQWNAAGHRITLPEELLALPLPQRDPYMKDVMAQHIRALGLEPDDIPVAERARSLLQEDFAAWRQADVVADALSMSRATLYRKLRQEGTRFSELLDDVRQQLHRRHAGTSVARLCELLGFEDASSYYKALRRWRERSR